MKKLLILFFALYSSNCLCQNDPQKMIDEFFRLYEKKSAEAALDYIFGTNQWMAESKDQIDNLKFKLINTTRKTGDFYGYKLLAKKGVGDRLNLYSYMIMYERQPLRFTFIFYRPDKEWRLQNFIFDDAFEDELKEAVKVYRHAENIN